MAYAMGVKIENIRQGLRTFDTTYFQAPGRLNVFDELPFKVILDYGHNPAAMQAMADLVRRLDVQRPAHRACSRRPAIAATRTSARSRARRAGLRPHHPAPRRRPARPRADEVPRLMAAALREAGVPGERASRSSPTSSGDRGGADDGAPGDLLVIFGDKLTRPGSRSSTSTRARRRTRRDATGRGPRAGAGPAARDRR